MAKSRRTGIRLRRDTFGDSQKFKKLTYTSHSNFDYLPPEKERIKNNLL